MAMTCTHIDTCLSSFLTDHHNREGELLLGVFANGNSTFGDIRRDLLEELRDATAAIDPADMPGFDIEEAKAAALELFADKHPNELDRSLFDEGLDFPDDEEMEMGETAQAWFLFRWDYPTPSDENGLCVHCGRDNTGYEDQPCSDECPAYWEARGIPHPDYP